MEELKNSAEQPITHKLPPRFTKKETGPAVTAFGSSPPPRFSSGLFAVLLAGVVRLRAVVNIRFGVHMAAGMLLLLMIGCGNTEEAFVSQQKEFGSAGWQYGDSLVVELEAAELPDEPTDVWLGLRFSEEYNYRNIWLKYRIDIPGDTTRTALTQWMLQEPTGEWLAGERGGYYGFEQPIVQGFRFNRKGTYRFTIIQFMRQDSLKGVGEARFRITPAADAAPADTPAGAQAENSGTPSAE